MKKHTKKKPRNSGMEDKPVTMSKDQFLSRVAADKRKKADEKRQLEILTIGYFAEKKQKAACAKKRRMYG